MWNVLDRRCHIIFWVEGANHVKLCKMDLTAQESSIRQWVWIGQNHLISFRILVCIFVINSVSTTQWMPKIDFYWQSMYCVRLSDSAECTGTWWETIWLDLQLLLWTEWHVHNSENVLFVKKFTHGVRLLTSLTKVHEVLKWNLLFPLKTTEL